MEMIESKNTHICLPTESYVVEYPEFNKLADTQLEKCFWTHSEISLEKDKQDLLTALTDSEKHAVITALKLFTKYELRVGEEYWLGRVFNTFKRPEPRRMASCFGNVELNVHAVFYSKINEVLGLATDDFYTSYIDDETLKQRIDFIDSLVNTEDDALSVACFSIVEGAILYTSFALFKHFQSNGKNLMMSLVRGINQSSIDENLHAIGGALLYRTLINQQGRENDKELQGKIYLAASSAYQHEEAIIKKFFEKGSIKGITEHQMQEFAKSRVNVALEGLGLAKLFDVKYNPIADWFYDGLNKFQFNDFFTSVGREYTRDWNADKFCDAIFKYEKDKE